MTNDFLHIELNELGAIKLNLSSEKRPKSNKQVISGYFNYEGNLVLLTEDKKIDNSLPLKFEHFFVELNNLIIRKQTFKNKNLLSIDLKVFDNEYKNFILQTLTYECIELDECFYLLQETINSINLHINQQGRISEINFPILPKSMKGVKKPRNIIQRIVENLSFKAFLNSTDRVGKDNKFWIEFEIYGLPKNEYLFELISNSFKTHYITSIIDDEILIELPGYYSYSASSERHEINAFDDLKIVQFNLVYDLIKKFSLSEFRASLVRHSSN